MRLAGIRAGDIVADVRGARFHGRVTARERRALDLAPIERATARFAG